MSVVLISLVTSMICYVVGHKLGTRQGGERAMRSEWPAPRPRLQPRPAPLDISHALHGERIFCTAKACDPRCHIRNPRLHVGARRDHG